MDAARWRRARELFEKVVDCPPTEWKAALLRECPDDTDRRGDALQLLQADSSASAEESQIAGRSPDILDGIASDVDKRRTDAWNGRLLGAWRIIRPIGRGGMGVVYLAERDDGQFRQQAAIKMLRGWDDSAAIARMVGERQILAGLEHPNIARLLDGGSSDDSGPWFALEYVNGVPIDAWCDAGSLDIATRLTLFLEICEAVSYAHEHLVVHRDLKPANILVDDTGRVVLLDFGIAKLLQTDTAQTGTALRAFTPEYAAPEQVRGDALSTAVDVYALGVVLYELLTGQRPYRVATRSSAAFEHAVLEQQAPRPSALVTRASHSEDEVRHDLARIASKRCLTPQSLRQRLRGDLDAIVLKALRKEPPQRYVTVREFAADIRAMLSHRPVEAHRGGLRYVAARFLRRNRVVVSMGALAILGLVAGLFVAVEQAREARLQRDTARQSLAFMTNLFENADPGLSASGDLSVRDLLDEGVRSIRFALPDGTAARAELMLAMASAYVGLEVNDAALPLILEAKDIARRVDDPALFATAVVRECRLLNYTNQYAACAEIAIEAAEGLNPADPVHADLRGELLARRVALMIADEQHKELIAEIMPVLASLKPALGNQETRVTLTGVAADAFAALGETSKAQSLLRDLIDTLDSEPVVNVRSLANARDFLSGLLRKLGETDESLQLNMEALAGFESLYGVDNPINSTKMNNLAIALYRVGRLDEAISMLSRVVEMNRDRAGGEGPGFGNWLTNLGAFLLMDERPADALDYLDEAVRLYEALGTRQAELAGVLWWRGAAHLSKGAIEPARTDFQTGDAHIHSKANDHPTRLRMRYSMLAADIINAGDSSLIDVACRDSEAIALSFSRQEDVHEPDAAFARFLAGLCRAAISNGSNRTSRIADLEAELDRSLGATDVRRQFARRVLAALDPVED